MRVDAIMSKELVCVEMDDTLETVKGIFDKSLFHHLLVIDSSKLVGIISDRDLFLSISPNIDSVAASTKDLASLNKRAHQIMTRKPVVLPTGSTVREAVTLFNSHTISCIPIVNDEFKAIGILSWRDIIRVIAAKA